MFDGSLYLLVKDHQRELHDAARRHQPVREWACQSDEVQERRAAAARRLLGASTHRG